MMERRKQGASVRQWIEEERERLSERAYMGMCGKHGGRRARSIFGNAVGL